MYIYLKDEKKPMKNIYVSKIKLSMHTKKPNLLHSVIAYFGFFHTQNNHSVKK